MKEIYMEKVIAQVKKNILRDGDAEPHFLIIDRDENMVAYEAGWDDYVGKQDVHNWLKRTVETLGSNRYFYVGTGWSLNEVDVRKAFEESRRVMLKKPSAKSVEILLHSAFKLMTAHPSENPASKEVIIVSEFEKHAGTKTVQLGITRDGKDAVSFGAVVSMTDVPRSYNWWNVWSPLQITVVGENDDT